MKKSKSTPNQSSSSRSKEQRYFSEEARIEIVNLIDNGELTVAEATRRYQVSSAAIYKWKKKYSPFYEPPLRKVIEVKSEFQKCKKLEKELAQAYEIIGKTQAKVMMLDKIIELAGEHYQQDLKKTFGSKPSSKFRKKSPGK